MIRTSKAILNFGKIDYYGRGRKEYEVNVEVELTEYIGEPTYTDHAEFSASGGIWNTHHTDYVCCGQCLDTIAEFIKDEDFIKVYGWWIVYHLNDLKAGTPEQTIAVDKWLKKGNKYEYDKVCEYLKSIGLYEVPCYEKEHHKQYNGEMYKYGHGWLIMDIPEHTVKEMREFIRERS